MQKHTYHQNGRHLASVMLGVAKALPHSNLQNLKLIDLAGLNCQEMDALCKGLEKNCTLQSLHLVVVIYINSNFTLCDWINKYCCHHKEWEQPFGVGKIMQRYFACSSTAKFEY